MGIIQNKARSQEEIKLQIKDFNDRLHIALIGCSQAKTTFTTLSDLWTSSRQEIITTLKSVAEEIDHHHHNVNIASLTGTSSSIAGGTAAIAGLVLAPFSGGASLALSAGGLVGTVAGTATTLGANIAEVVLTRELLDRAKKMLDTDSIYTRALSEAFRELIIHENEVVAVLSELKEDSLTEDLQSFLSRHPHGEEVKKHLKRMKTGARTLEDIVALLSFVCNEESEFLQQLNKTDRLFDDTPSLSSTVSSSSEFFQAVKEIVAVGPETLKGISGSALQSTAATAAQMAPLTTQLITAGLGAVFVALDIYNFMKTSKNFDEGSKTVLAQKIRDTVRELEKEKDQIENLANFYKERTNKDLCRELFLV